MKEGNIAELRNPGSMIHDLLTEVLRHGARKLLAEAIEIEVEAFLGDLHHLRDEEGRLRLVRNGYLPERQVQTGIGNVAVKVPRVRDRCPDPVEGPIRFSSKILPRYLRRTKSLEELVPWLYLKGVSTGEMAEALTALLGPGSPGLSPSTVTRLKEVWHEDLERWRKRDLSCPFGKRA
uniref:Mutator family transposase n=1 Tax=Desulfacinum infernum TaxID=35837 RepID=A0A832A4T4_9BACT